MIKLGLIGDNILASSSPRLHRLAGEIVGLEVTYDALIPRERNQDFHALFDWCAGEGGYRGVNITFPYKEMVFERLTVNCPTVQALGACNTAIFEDGLATGYNTDFSGFQTAYRNAFPNDAPGHVAMAGAGGVGKAIAFGLATLGAKSIRIFDPALERAEQLVSAIKRTFPDIQALAVKTIESACANADGLVNSTPLGMVGYPGSAFPTHLLAKRRWVFDAVYTPVDTQFLTEATLSGATCISGYELFFHQGVDAFNLFAGQDIDKKLLRAQLKHASKSNGRLCGEISPPD